MKTIALAAVAGLATVASAGADFSLTLVPSAMTVDVSGGAATITIDVIGDSSFGTHMLGGAFTLGSSNALVTDMAWSPASWSSFNTDDGYAGNGNYNQVIFGQLVIPGVPPFDVPAAGSDLGSSIGSFTVTFDGGSGIVDFGLTAGSPFTLEAIDVNTGGTFQSADGSLSLNGASVNVIPAPSAMALLGLGGLVAGRRRR
ncbi:MAG TPA: hypothetical protein DF699_08165 [Phycisphaerales bacterium]|nr:hypothetical protein [Phycisphaerales bacterium]|tara:strand:- start:897 stop:1496 length:600 start_codon:yes stop_codon:yes gene_type:complete